MLADRGWSKAQLAAEAGLSMRTIHRVAAGQPTSHRVLQDIAYALGEPVERLTTPPQPRTPLEAAMHANGWTTTELARHVDLQPSTIRYLRAAPGGQAWPMRARLPRRWRYQSSSCSPTK